MISFLISTDDIPWKCCHLKRRIIKCRRRSASLDGIPSLIVLLNLIAFYTDQGPGPNVRGIEFPPEPGLMTWDHYQERRWH